jgi:hypothetical protein
MLATLADGRPFRPVSFRVTLLLAVRLAIRFALVALRLSWWLGRLAAVVATAAWVGACVLAFRRDPIWPVVGPLLAIWLPVAACYGTDLLERSARLLGVAKEILGSRANE